MNVIQEQANPYSNLAHIQIVTQLVAAEHIANTLCACLTAEAIVEADFILIFKGTQRHLLFCNASQQISGIQQAQGDTHGIDHILVTLFVIVHRAQDRSLGSIRQVQAFYNACKVVCTAMVTQTVAQLLDGNISECCLQLTGRVFCVELLNTGLQLCLQSSICAVSKDRSHHNHIGRILGEVDINNALERTGNVDHIVLISDNVLQIRFHIHGYRVCQSTHQLTGLINNRAVNNDAQRNILGLVRCANAHRHIVAVGNMHDLQFPGCCGEGIGCKLIACCQSIFNRCKICKIINKHINDIRQIRCRDPAQAGVDGRIDLIIACEQTDHIADLGIKYLTVFDKQACFIIVIEYQTGSHFQCQLYNTLLADQIPNFTGCCVQLNRDIAIAFCRNTVQLVGNNAVVSLNIAIIHICGNIAGILAVQQRDIAGNRTSGTAGNCLLISIVDDHKVGILAAGDITVDGFAVEIQQSGGVNGQVTLYIVQQHQHRHTGKVLSAGQQLLLSPHAQLIQDTVCTDIQEHCCVICAEILPLQSCSSIYTGGSVVRLGRRIIVFINQLAQVHTDALGQLHFVNNGLQLSNGCVNGNILHSSNRRIICIGNADRIISLLEQLKVMAEATQIHFFTQLCKGVFIGLYGDILTNGRSQQILHISNCDLGINIIDIVDVHFANQAQSCQICAVCLFRQHHVQICTIVVQIKGDAGFLQLQQCLSGSCHPVYGASKCDVQLSRCGVVGSSTKVHNGLHHNTAQIIHIIRLNCVQNLRGALQNQLLGNVAVLVNEIQQGVCADAAVKDCIHSCLQMVLAAVKEQLVIQTNVLILRQEQTDGEVGHIVLHGIGINPQDDGIFAVCILGQDCSAVHAVYQLDQCTFSQIYRLAGDDQVAFCCGLKLCQCQGVSTGTVQNIIDIVLILIVRIFVGYQGDIAVCIGNNTNELAVYLHLVGLQRPACGEVCILINGYIFLSEAVGHCIVIRNIIGQTQLCHQELRPSGQFCIGNGMANTYIHCSGYLGTVKLYRHGDGALAGTGLLHSSGPDHLIRHLRVVSQLCFLSGSTQGCYQAG